MSRASRTGFRAAVAFVLTLAAGSISQYARAAEGIACRPFADVVLGWDLAADLYVVATHYQGLQSAGPAHSVPNLLELRRISSGAQIHIVTCETARRDSAGNAEPCDFRTLFGSLIPRAARFVPRGPPLPRGRVFVARSRDGSGAAFALMARPASGGAAHRLRWLEHVAGQRERATLHVGASEIWQDDVALVVETRFGGGPCPRTEVKVLRMRRADLDRSAGPADQQLQLARLTLSSSLAAWRTAADLGPLPPQKLVFAMVVAAEAGRQDLAVRWWREGTATLPLDRVAVVAAALRERPELVTTRQLLTLPPEP